MKKKLSTNAIIWAIVMIVAFYLYRNAENYSYLLGVLIVGITLQNGFTYETLKKKLKLK